MFQSKNPDCVTGPKLDGFLELLAQILEPVHIY